MNLHWKPLHCVHGLATVLQINTVAVQSFMCELKYCGLSAFSGLWATLSALKLFGFFRLPRCLSRGQGPTHHSRSSDVYVASASLSPAKVSWLWAANRHGFRSLGWYLRHRLNRGCGPHTNLPHISSLPDEKAIVPFETEVLPINIIVRSIFCFA
jgi:hypothetical protein